MLDDGLNRLLRLVEAQEAAEDRMAAEWAAAIGDNGGPPLDDLFGLGAPWMEHADEAELARLAKLAPRIMRRQKILSETIAERTKIMNRCIRRMRRARGQN
ncbi:hypothetical protein PhaeoP48_01193 [Phaeobacter inhibens]|uniref:hypothetical protein n=1 Tax=Phaeobacter inhibens TaxID=221822 RepID=UPI000C99BF74|nr:hypothetical protein [Phaeobacter inhibens]AUR11190.1 hypothetical protein PhaeoP48_01193 [Phaeobacter inhibens]